MSARLVLSNPLLLVAAVVLTLAAISIVSGPVPASSQDHTVEVSSVAVETPAPTIQPTPDRVTSWSWDATPIIPARPTGPTPTIPPALQLCTLAPPQFAIQHDYPYVGTALGWWAGGLQPNTQVVITITNTVNPNTPTGVFKTFTQGNVWCQAVGTIVLPEPVPYQVNFMGISATTGELVSIDLWPVPLPPPPSVPTPVPPRLPAAPINVRVRQLNDTTARVDWDAVSPTETGFVVVTKTGRFPAASHAQTLDVGGLLTGEIYCFRVYAENAVGRSIPDLDSVDCLLMRPATSATR